MGASTFRATRRFAMRSMPLAMLVLFLVGLTACPLMQQRDEEDEGEEEGDDDCSAADDDDSTGDDDDAGDDDAVDDDDDVDDDDVADDDDTSHDDDDTNHDDDDTNHDDDDDDTWVPDDDDDTWVPDDDDDTWVPDDDDDSVPSVDCPIGSTIYSDAEPNDSPATAQDLGSSFLTMACFQGATTCGTGAYDDEDWFQFEISFAMPFELEFTLDWDVTADLDFMLYDSYGLVVINGATSTTPPEVGTVELDADTYQLMIGCMDGADGGYALSVGRGGP